MLPALECILQTPSNGSAKPRLVGFRGRRGAELGSRRPMREDDQSQIGCARPSDPEAVLWSRSVLWRAQTSDQKGHVIIMAARQHRGQTQIADLFDVE